MGILAEVIFILVLILLNGIFALSELAVVSARPARLQERADRGHQGAKTALQLAKTPEQFLSTVQVGITLVGVLTGAFGGATLADFLSDQYAQIPPLAPYSDGLGLGTIVALITYFSLVFGELVPKQLALRNPEGIASLIAAPMRRLSQVTFPVVRLLSLSTRAVVRLLGAHDTDSPPVTEEEIRIMLRTGAEAGIFKADEQHMVESVFLLDDRPIRQLITPRTEIVWLDQHATIDTIRATLQTANHSRLPVCDGDLDRVLGVVHSHDLVTICLNEDDFTLTDHLHKPLFIPENSTVSIAVDLLRKNEEYLLFVINEHGGVDGIVTDHDVLEAIVGDIPSPGEFADPDVVVRADGSWLLDGMMTTSEFKTLLQLDALPKEDENAYDTLAGLVIMLLDRIPKTGDILHWDHFEFEIVDMDGRRIDKVLLTRHAESAGDAPNKPDRNGG